MIKKKLKMGENTTKFKTENNMIEIHLRIPKIFLIRGKDLDQNPYSMYDVSNCFIKMLKM